MKQPPWVGFYSLILGAAPCPHVRSGASSPRDLRRDTDPAMCPSVEVGRRTARRFPLSASSFGLFLLCSLPLSFLSETDLTDVDPQPCGLDRNNDHKEK